MHEALTTNNGPMNIEWFLKHKRDPNPRKVRIRSAELRNAAAWWARVHAAGESAAVHGRGRGGRGSQCDPARHRERARHRAHARRRADRSSEARQSGLEWRGTRSAHAERCTAPDQQHLQTREAAQDAGAAGIFHAGILHDALRAGRRNLVERSRDGGAVQDQGAGLRRCLEGLAEGLAARVPRHRDHRTRTSRDTR